MHNESSIKAANGLIVLVFIVAAAGAAFAEPITYTYDATNRLIYANDNGTIIQYVYDKVGNLLQRNKPLTVDHPFKDFGNVYVGTTSAAQTFTISNVGTGNLAISTVLINGPDNTSFIITGDTCSGGTILPSTTCTVQAAFSPSTLGSKSANIQITFSTPAALTLTIPLSGNLYVRIARTPSVYFSPLQDAYDAAADRETIQSQAMTFVTDLNVNRNITVRLDGGYDGSFNTVIGQTIVNGQIHTSSGTITITNIKTRK